MGTNTLIVAEDLWGENDQIQCIFSPFGFLSGDAFSLSLNLDRTLSVLGGWVWGVGRELPLSSCTPDICEAWPQLVFFL